MASGPRGEMEWEFSEDDDGDGNFVATGKVVTFLSNHLARGEMREALALYESCAENVGDDLLADFPAASTRMQKAMANLFFRARDYKRAAHACEQLGEWSAAARSYEASYAYAEAANCYVRANQSEKAASIYKKAGRHDRAAELYSRAGNHEGAAAAMADGGDPIGAGRLLVEAEDYRGAARWLASVAPEDARFYEAVLLLAETLSKLHREDVAVQRLAAALPQDGILRVEQHAAVAYKLGELLEVLARDDEAHQAFELVRSFDPGYRNVIRKGRHSVIPVPQPPSERTDPADGMDDLDLASGALVTRMEDYDLLKSLPIFNDLSLDEMKDFYRLCENKKFEKGEVLIEPGQPGQGLFITREGTLRVSTVDGDSETTVATISAGKYVGEMSLIDDAPTSARVTAESDVKAFHIGKEAFQQYLYSHDLVALRVYRTFTKTLVERLRIATQKISG